MKLRARSLLLPLLLAVLLGCATIEEAQDAQEPAPAQSLRTAAPEKSHVEEREEPELTVQERPPIESLLPDEMRLLTEEGSPALRRGDFDSDGREDEAYLAITGDPVDLRLLAAEERLYQQEPADFRDSRLLLRLASGEDLILNTGELLLLSEFSSVPLAAEEREPLDALIYLRFENREKQRHLLFSVSPIYKTPHRYLFLTDSATGFLIRDVDGDGNREVVHIETTVYPSGFEESFYTLYLFRGRQLERRARFPVVERTNELFQELRRLFIAGERDSFLRRYTDNGNVDSYFVSLGTRPISQVLGVEFVYVPELRSNPFNLSQRNPDLRTEILVLAQGEEQLYGVRVGFVVEPEGGPKLRLLPVDESN